MHIAKYYHAEGYLNGGPAGYYDKDNTYVGETPQEFIQSGILGHCCCGDVENSQHFIKHLLTDISQRKWNRDNASCAEYTVVYYLDKLGLIEHGTALPGWLTKEGKELLDDLTELYPD